MCGTRGPGGADGGRDRCYIPGRVRSYGVRSRVATSRSRRILLTGASSGIGLDAALRLVRRGHRVWGTSRDPARLPRVSGLHPIALDLCSPESIESAVAFARESAGAFDVLVNNAGSGRFGPLEHLDDDHVRDQFQVLVFGPLQMIRLLLPDLCEARGKIINVSSLAAQYPIPYMGPYSAAKAALSTLSWTLQMELRQHRVQVVDLQPGDILTGFNEHLPRSPPEEAGAYRENQQRAFEVYDANQRRACGPERAGESIVRLVESERGVPPRVTVGSRFPGQSGAASRAARSDPRASLGSPTLLSARGLGGEVRAGREARSQLCENDSLDQALGEPNRIGQPDIRYGPAIDASFATRSLPRSSCEP